MEPTPAEDWRTARVDVIIPALNEASHITLCLASLLRQTLRPRQIVLIDDGSHDGTVDIARAFCELNALPLTAIRRKAPIGKTPTLKRQARELDSDVEFILDGDTVLESERYIERVVQELYQGVGIACACGTILPYRHPDRRRWLEDPAIKRFAEAHPEWRPRPDTPAIAAARAVTNAYRDVLYAFLQRFVYRGQNIYLGTITNPVGCAVAYRRTYVKELFDHFGPIFGDDLTNSEDIFIGFAMLDMGYRNIQVPDVRARTVEPPVFRLPRQLNLWSSAFLQSCYYFDPLLRSPLKALRRGLARLRHGSGAPSVETPAPAKPRTGDVETAPKADRRLIAEPYRQPFGRHWTIARGRPAGWMLLMEAIEKVFFPTTLLILIILRAWESLALTLAIDTAVGVCVLGAVMKDQRLEYVGKALLIAPLRYLAVAADLVTIGIFAWHVWVTKERTWRK